MGVGYIIDPDPSRAAPTTSTWNTCAETVTGVVISLCRVVYVVVRSHPYHVFSRSSYTRSAMSGAEQNLVVMIAPCMKPFPPLALRRRNVVGLRLVSVLASRAVEHLYDSRVDTISYRQNPALNRRPRTTFWSTRLKARSLAYRGEQPLMFTSCVVGRILRSELLLVYLPLDNVNRAKTLCRR